MRINLIPSSDTSISYGIEAMVEAIRRYHKYLLVAVHIYPEQETEIVDEKIKGTTRQTFILLFREPGSIGLVTGFINEWGTNINSSGTGGMYGQEMLDILEEYKINPIVLTQERIFKGYPDLKKSTQKNQPLVERLPIWEKVIESEVVPRLCRNTGTILGLENYTGGWANSWDAENNK